MRARTATMFVAFAISCLVLLGGPTALAGEAAPRDEARLDVIEVRSAIESDGESRPHIQGDREVVKVDALFDSQVFQLLSQDHLAQGVITNWCGALLRVHVMDPTEVSVLGGWVANVGPGSAGAAELAGLPAQSHQHASSFFTAHAFNTDPNASLENSGITIATSHSFSAAVTFHVKNTDTGENSDVDLLIQKYMIFHLPGGSGSTALVESDMVWATSQFVPTPEQPIPPDPPAWDYPNAHWVHLDFPAHVPPGIGSAFVAFQYDQFDIGIDHGGFFPGQNPDIRMYLDADPNQHVHEIHPNASETFDVYVCLDCFGEGGGTRGTAFLLVRTFQGFKLSQTALLGGLDFGDAEVDGWTIAAGSDCVYPDADGVVCVGVIQYLYLGVPGTLDIAPHPGTGREVLDCDFVSDYYCIHANLGVSMPPNPGEQECECEPAAVQDMSWGAIKGLFR